MLLSGRAVCAPELAREAAVADTRADVPGGRVRRVLRQDPAIHHRREGLFMAKKAKGGKKKAAAKKR